MKSFIVGKELTQTADICCPYCRSKKMKLLHGLMMKRPFKNLVALAFTFSKKTANTMIVAYSAVKDLHLRI
jgi:hypothetical protein